MSPLPAFMLGGIGFIGFEALRFYGEIRNGREPVPGNRYGLYSLTIVVVASFAAFLCTVIPLPHNAYALYLGFSLPSSADAIVGRLGKKAVDVQVDDIDVEKDPHPSRHARMTPLEFWRRLYLR